MTQADSTNSTIPYFSDVVGSPPYLWQQQFYAACQRGEPPEAIDIPTGLGKTVSLLLLLLARLQNPNLPARVVYIVDRRAVVDQTAALIETWIERIAALPGLAEKFHAMAAFPSDRPVQLGVLRGGLADDGAWRVDPARASVVIGTVDMVGSKMLFAGYGDGRSRRSMHAGLLGHDAIAVLDEAHLSPAMDAVLHAVTELQRSRFFRSVTLSATGRERSNALGLSVEKETHPAVRQRLHAVKRLDLRRVKTPGERVDALCTAALAHSTGAIAIFVQTVEDARRIASRLLKIVGDDASNRVALLTGTLRGHERVALVNGAVWQRFLPGRPRDPDAPASFLVMTAAGEVGVDLDADHGAMDLGTLDSMIQRIGRINRAGERSATVTVVVAEKDTERVDGPAKTRRQRLSVARGETLAVLEGLPGLSPAVLHALDRAALARCTVSRVHAPPLHAEVIEAFAATSASLELPPVGIYLRGVSDEPDAPDTFLVWRWDVPRLVSAGREAARETIAFFRPRPEEIARVPERTAKEIIQAARQRWQTGHFPLIVVRPNGDVTPLELSESAEDPSLAYATVLLPTMAGGLRASGLPDPRAAAEVSDVGDIIDGDNARIRFIDPAGEPGDVENERPAWLPDAIQLRVGTQNAETGQDSEAGEAVGQELVYARRRSDPALQAGESHVTWLGASTQTVEDHCARVATAARKIGAALKLSDQLVSALETAGAWHDRGKDRPVWQLAAGVPPGGPALAKSRKGILRSDRLGGYRHEFGSLAEAERELSEDCPHRDLVLHLIAAHHGWARPGFPLREQWDPEDSSASNRERALRTADRFGRLQAEYGPWRLAWLEALLKAADARVSSQAEQPAS